MSNKNEKINTPVPDKLYKTIRLALVDLVKCENDPRYKINMYRWHINLSKCNVCFAGAVMAQTRKMPINRHITPEDDLEWERIYRALNLVRRYDIYWALADFYDDIDIIDRFDLSGFDEYNNSLLYDQNRDIWFKNMHEIADKLEELDL